MKNFVCSLSPYTSGQYDAGMSSPIERSATYEDLLAVPSHLVAELVGGTLHTSPRPAPPHANAASVLGADLNRAYQRGHGGPGGWFILDEPELHLGRDVCVPDVAGWRRERMPTLPSEAFFALPPDWICEVLSPSTARFDRVEKMPVYAQHGVGHLWLVDPAATTLEIYRLRDGHWTRIAAHGGEEVVRAEPFQEMAIDLSELWSPAS